MRKFTLDKFTVIIQDGYIIQLKKQEKIPLDAANLNRLKEKKKTTAKRKKEGLHAKILQAVKELQYGQVVILIKRRGCCPTGTHR